MQLPRESQISSAPQPLAASPASKRSAERRPTKRIHSALSPAIKPTRYQNSRMREFNRDFGYKTSKHPFACCLGNIRRWIPSDNRKDCRPYPRSIVSAPDDQSLSTENESYAPHIERLSNTGSSTDVQHSRLQSMLDTPLDDSREDATSYDVIIEGTDNEQQR